MTTEATPRTDTYGIPLDFRATLNLDTMPPEVAAVVERVGVLGVVDVLEGVLREIVTTALFEANMGNTYLSIDLV